MRKLFDTVKNSIVSGNSFVFIFCFIILASFLTYVIPAGAYDRVVNEAGQEVILEGSFHRVPSSPVNPMRMFQCVAQAFINSADVIFCIVFAYCFVGVMVREAVFDVLISFLIGKLRQRVKLILPLIMILFGLMGSVAGLAEETFGMFPVCISLALALGYDEIVGGAIVYLAVFTGFASATFNPYTVGIAQSIAGIPIYSGLGFRIVCWFVFMGILIAYVMHYANRVKANPSESIMYGTGKQKTITEICPDRDVTITIRQKLCMLLFGLTMALVVSGAILWGWYLTEISAVFLAAAIIAGAVIGWGPSKIAESFVELGAETMFSILVIGLSNGVCVILDTGEITDSIVYGMASLIHGTSGYVSACLMLAVQNLLNFFVPSGPGQAAVSMPIMASLADVTGLSRQLAVLAFQFGDGYSNIFWPTMVCMMCGIMKIPVAKWYRFLFPLFGIMLFAQVVLLMLAVKIGY